MWLIIFVFFLVLIYIYKLNSPSRRVCEYGDKIPGPKSYPLIGSASVFFSSKSNTEIITELYDKYGDVFRLWIGNKLVVVLSNPDDIAELLSNTKYLNKPFSYRLLDSWMGDTNMLTGNGEVWRQHRKQLTPSFHFKIVEKAVPMMYRNSKILSDKLEAEVDRYGFNVERYIEKSTLDIIGEIAMGIRLDTQSSPSSSYLDSLKKLSSAILNRFLNPWLQSEIIFQWSKTGREYYQNLKVVKKEGQKVIQERKKLLQENNKIFDDSEESNDDGKRKLKPFLDFVLTQGTFSDVEVENEVQTFMFAGHDTTKSGISFALFCLASNQEAQEKAVQEIREMLSNRDEEPSYQDFLDLKYLENVIKESMRLYSPVPFISRVIDKDLILPSGYLIPAGSTADVSIYLTHRNAKFFPDPLKFIPERFEERDGTRNPYAYIPFSAGARNCIGQKFAMLEMRIILAVLLLKYQFLPDEKAEPVVIESNLVLQAKNRIPIKIKKRNIS